MSDQPESEELTAEEREALLDPNNAANPAAVSAKKKNAKALARLAAARDARINSVLTVMLDSLEGREFLGWLMVEVAGLFRQEVPIDMDPHRALYLGGARGVALALHERLIRLDPVKYMHVMGLQLKDFANV